MYYPAGQKFTQNHSISYSFRDIKTFSRELKGGMQGHSSQDSTILNEPS